MRIPSKIPFKLPSLGLYEYLSIAALGVLILMMISGMLKRTYKRGDVKHVNKHHKKCDKCNCTIPFMMGRSKCYDCDRQLAKMHCSDCESPDTDDTYLSRELSLGKPNAKLGYV
jgi:hypothetical protein